MLLTLNTVLIIGISVFFNTFQQSWNACIWFVCLSACASSNLRKYSSNVLKFMYIIHVWYNLDVIENGRHGSKDSSTETHKSFPIRYGLCRGIFRGSVYIIDFPKEEVIYSSSDVYVFFNACSPIFFRRMLQFW